MSRNLQLPTTKSSSLLPESKTIQFLSFPLLFYRSRTHPSFLIIIRCQTQGVYPVIRGINPEGTAIIIMVWGFK